MDQAAFVRSLFTGALQHENFNRLATLFPTKGMSAAPEPRRFPKGTDTPLPSSYVWQEQCRDTEAFLHDTDTVALLALQDGALRAEHYWLTGSQDTHWISMSVGKSFVSAAVGIAVAEGAIASIDQPVTAYAPSLAGSAYDGVSIKDVLQMSSGARWNEDYSDPDAEIIHFMRIFGSGESFNDFAATLARAEPPGTVNLYKSIDTQVLGMVLAGATGRGLADYMQEKLWHPLGMEAEGYWLTDSRGVELAFGGLNATARDYAKLGELFRLKGRWKGRQILPAEWVRDSIAADAVHLRPAPPPEETLGYGYQWWVPYGSEGEFAAIGIYNQYIYVNPARRTVIVKLSATRGYGLTNDESSYRTFETFALLRAIASSLG